MHSLIRHLAASIVVFSAGTAIVRASEPNTWYAYCEGESDGAHWAVFSQNFWPHPPTEGYGREVGMAAKAFFESRHAMSLEGCTGVDFVDTSLAEHSRARTALLHEQMGDRIYYFQLPAEALPRDAQVTAPVLQPVDFHTAEPAQKAISEPTASQPKPTEKGWVPRRAPQ